LLVEIIIRNMLIELVEMSRLLMIISRLGGLIKHGAIEKMLLIVAWQAMHILLKAWGVRRCYGWMASGATSIENVSFGIEFILITGCRCCALWGTIGSAVITVDRCWGTPTVITHDRMRLNGS
jgi:hypothetical protein